MSSTSIQRKPYSDLIRLDQLFNGEGAPDILCLGDSVFERISKDDTDTAPFGQMLRSGLEETGRTEFICQPGYHLGIYEHLLSTVLRMKHQPRLVVLPVNLRSFSLAWYRHPLWCFDHEIGVLKEYAAGLDASSFRIPDLTEENVSYDEFDALPVDHPQSPYETAGQFQNIIHLKSKDPEVVKARHRALFIFYYLYRLAGDHPLLEALKRISALLSLRGISLFLYSTPINHEAGTRHLGQLFMSKIGENTRKIIETLGAETPYANFMDYSLLFGSEHFFTPDNPTEHLRTAARNQLAEKISKISKEVFIASKKSGAVLS